MSSSEPLKLVSEGLTSKYCDSTWGASPVMLLRFFANCGHLNHIPLRSRAIILRCNTKPWLEPPWNKCNFPKCALNKSLPLEELCSVLVLLWVFESPGSWLTCWCNMKCYLACCRGLFFISSFLKAWCATYLTCFTDTVHEEKKYIFRKPRLLNAQFKNLDLSPINYTGLQKKTTFCTFFQLN